jgi:hypothetical protein
MRDEPTMMPDDPEPEALFGLHLTVYEEWVRYCLCPFCAFQTQRRRDEPWSWTRVKTEMWDHLCSHHPTELVTRLRGDR